MLTNPEKLVFHTGTIVEVCQNIKDGLLISYFFVAIPLAKFFKNQQKKLDFFRRARYIAGVDTQ